MFNVMYKGEIHTVYNVQCEYGEHERFDPFCGPVATWFLISKDDSFVWVASKWCKPVI